MGTVRETLAKSTEETPQFGPERPRVFSDLSPEEKDWYNADIRATNILLQRLPTDIYTLLNHYTDAKDVWDNVKMLLEGSELTKEDRESQLNQSTVQDGRVVVQNVQGRQNRGQGMNPRGGGAAGYRGGQTRVGNVNQGQARPVKCYNCNGGHDNAFDDDVDEQHVQDLALNVDKVFQADDCDAFDSDVDEAPTTQTMFMANLSSADLVTDEAGPSYDSNILSEYIKDNEVPIVHSNVSSVLNDAFMMIYNDMCEPHAQSVSNPSRNTVVKNSLTAELATYKEQVKLYERRAKFELTELEQKINEQLRLVISDCNFKEETLKKELHSIKLQLASTINHNKSMVEEVTFLKKDFKQKENKYLEDFLDMKSLKEKVEDRLIKQDQSLQTVHMLCRPKPYYNELNKVAIGYMNPLCLTRAKQVQPALYTDHEIIKDNHAPAIVHNTEDTLEISEIPRKKMNDKMKDPKCVTRKVKIAPHDYSKENFLATFTPQKQLILEQIFWSNDLIKLKSEALKEQTTVSRPIKALTMYPPNTPATLVLRVLPTKSQVKIHIFTLIQLFSEFDKTCKKRITPTGLTEGERGFKQTKECYLKEAILFFKTLKDNFEGIQKALTNEIKKMKDVFEELEAKVAQNVVDRKHDAIEQKNLLIANDNLIAECLSKEVFYVATNSELNVARFTKMTVAHITIEARCLALEAELANLHKYTPDFDLVFVIGKMLASLQGKDNVIRQLKKQISQLQVTRSDTDHNLKVRTAYSQITKLTEQVTNLQAQNNFFMAENDKIKQHYKELKDQVKPKVLARGKYAIDVETIVPRLRNNRDAHLDYLRHLKEIVETIRDIVEEAKVVVQIVLWYLDSSCSKHMTGDRSRLMNFVKKFIGTIRFGNDHFGAIMGYGDYVIGDSVISRVYYLEGLGHNLFSVGKFCDSGLEVAFRKHSCYVRDTNGVELIKGSRGSNLYTILVEDMMKSSPICLLSKASKNKSWLWHRRLNHLNFGTINDLTVPKTPQQNGVVERWNRTLVEAARTMLIFSKTLMFLWAKVVATAVFGALCYPTNDSEDLGKLQPTADIGIFVGYAPNKKGYRIYNKKTRRIMETIHVQFNELTKQMAPVHLDTGPVPNFLTPGQISSGLVPNLVPATPYVPSQIKNWIFYFIQCLMNIWNLLVLKDQFILLKQ
nr:integrase, catalytic region, zinc finger, CCHC-type, peptidase aspartic, catalytic [Tanacetum cinerariifolium]